MVDNETSTGHENVLASISALRNESNWDLNAKNLTDEDIRILANELHSNTKCHVLHLHLNNITDAGIFYLADMLKVNQTLTDLYLGANDFGDRGVELLCQALIDHNRTLVVIDLTCNRIMGDSMHMILNLFKVNDQLKGFMLTNNAISEENKDKLRKAAEVSNITLGVDF